jgi:hypothetical protein
MTLPHPEELSPVPMAVPSEDPQVDEVLAEDPNPGRADDRSER